MKATPLLLSTGTVALSNIPTSSPPAGEIPTNSAQLASPFRTAFLAKELRFTALSSGPLSSSDSMFLQAKLWCGRWAICPIFIPVSSFAVEVQSTPERSSAGNITDGNGKTFNYSMFRWRFPRPFYVPPGNGFTAVFNRITDYGTTGTKSGVALEMAIAGDSLPADAPVPKTTCVPYVAAYSTGKIVTTIPPPPNYTGAAPSSSASDLLNPFDRPLYVQRLISRFYRDTGSVFATNIIDTANGSTAFIRLLDSRRNPITWGVGSNSGDIASGIVSPNDGGGSNVGYLRMGEVFDVRTRALEYRRYLPAKEYLIASMQNAQSSYTYWLSMLGCREEAIS